MKKANIFLVCILAISLVICGFIVVSSGQKEKNTNVKIEDVKNKEMKINLKDKTSKNLKYKHTSEKNGLFPEVVVYTDENNTEYSFDKKTGRIKGVNYKKDLTTNKEISFEQAESIAKNEFEKYVDITEYQFNSDDSNKNDLSYFITFSKHINGIPSQEGVSAIVNKDGGVFSIRVSDEKVDEESLLEKSKSYLSKEKALEILNDQITKDTSNIKNYSGFSVKESKLRFSYDNRLVWCFMVELKETDNSTIESTGHAATTFIGKSYYLDANTKEFVKYEF